MRSTLLLTFAAWCVLAAHNVAARAQTPPAQPAPGAVVMREPGKIQVVGVWRAPHGLAQIPIWPSDTPDMKDAVQSASGTACDDGGCAIK